MKETKVIELSADKDYNKELKKYEDEGWQVVAGEPIEKICVKIVGKKFTLKRDKESE